MSYYQNIGDATRAAALAVHHGEYACAGWLLGFADHEALVSLPYGSPERKEAQAWLDGCLVALYAIEARARA